MYYTLYKFYKILQLKEIQLDFIVGSLIGIVLIISGVYIHPIIYFIIGLMLAAIIGYYQLCFKYIVKEDHSKIKFIKKHIDYIMIPLYFEFAFTIVTIFLTLSYISVWLPFLHDLATFSFGLTVPTMYRCYWICKRTLQLLQEYSDDN